MENHHGARKRFDALADLSRLFEYVPGAQFWIKDRESRILDCNTAFLAHFGFRDKTQIRGRTDFDISPHPLAREYILDDEAVTRTGKPMVEKLELVKESDDSMHWYATTKTPLCDTAGNVIGTAGFTRRVKPAADSGGPTHRMERAIKHIHIDYAENITIPALARIAGMSVDNFERRFRALMRETPLRYLTRIRMRSACGLLIHTDLSVGAIAAQTGFSDQSYFAKRFFAHLRIRPLEYRRKYAKASASGPTPRV